MVSGKTTGILISILLVLVSTFMVIDVYGGVATSFSKTFDAEACYLMLGAQELIEGATSITLFRNKCKTIVVNDLNDIDDFEVYITTLSDYVGNAWRVTQQGKELGLWESERFAPVFAARTKCFILYHIKFFPKDKDKFEGLSMTKAEYKLFLLNTHYRDYNGRSYDYWNYVQSAGKKGAILLGARNESAAAKFIVPYEEYAISIISPQDPLFAGIWYDDDDFSERYKNTLVVSTLRYAREDLKCLYVTPQTNTMEVPA